MDRPTTEVFSAIDGDPGLQRNFEALCGFGGRLSGSAGEREALDYLTACLGEICDGRAVAQPVPYDGWRARACRLERLAPAPAVFAAHALVGSPPTAADGLEAEIVDLGRGTEADVARHRAALPGRIALVRHEYMFRPGHVHRGRKYQIACDAGAAGFLIANHLPGSEPVAGGIGLNGPATIPGAGVGHDAAKQLAADGGPPKRARLLIDVERGPAQGCNLIAEIPGRSDAWVVLSAHVDGHDLGASAIDNASGVAAALAAARALAPHVPALARGLRVCLFSVEEWGLIGSRHYVDGLTDDERARIALNVNLDSVAGAAHLTALTGGFERLDPLIAATAAGTGIDIATYRPLLANSDHYNFARHGIPAFRLVAGFDDPESRVRHVLTAGDTADKVTDEELARAARVTAAAVLRACGESGLDLRGPGGAP